MRFAALWSTNPTPVSLVDDEFGVVRLRRNARAKYIRLRMEPSGELVVTLPTFAQERHARDLLESSRPAIRKWQLTRRQTTKTYRHGDSVGHSHSVQFVPTSGSHVSIKRTGLIIVAELPSNTAEDTPTVQRALQPHIAKALQKEARAYLPRRLRYLADTYGFRYTQVRFGTQKGRWGSCSSKGTISLNVGLMELETELIDYVLIHELCHTRQMNHSSEFWTLVEQCMPDYKLRRKELKRIQPNT